MRLRRGERAREAEKTHRQMETESERKTERESNNKVHREI